MRRGRTLTREQRNRLAFGVLFALTNVALFVFALIPTTTLAVMETVVLVLSVVGFVLVIGNALPNRKVRGQQFGYLFTGATALFAGGAFLLETASKTDWTWFQRLSVAMFLATFAVGAMVAHIVTGAEDRDADD